MIDHLGIAHCIILVCFALVALDSVLEVLFDISSKVFLYYVMLFCLLSIVLHIEGAALCACCYHFPPVALHAVV